MDVKTIIRSSLLKVLSSRYGKIAGGNLPRRLGNLPIVQLTDEQKEECGKVWLPLSNKLDWRYWTLYNSLDTFNPQMVPDDLFIRYIIRTLNPIKTVYAFQNKNNYPIIYATLNRPATVLSGIDGNIYDENNKLVEDSDIELILRNFAIKSGNPSFILKPTGSYGGIGVKKITINEINSSELLRLFNSVNRCFVCQELVQQSSVTSVFNTSSLNTFRINTLNLNGSITSTNILFRHGQPGSIVDNGGSGGICCGVSNDGQFSGEAYDTNLKRYKESPFKKSYAEVVIPEVKDIVDYAINAHRQYLPMVGHAAWDFGLDKNGNPIFIEVNLGWPGIVIEQLACRAPIYGERTEEVIDHVVKNRHKIKWTEFTGDWI